MRYFSYCLIAAVVGCSQGRDSGAAPQKEQAEDQLAPDLPPGEITPELLAFAKENNQLAFDIYEELRKTEGNFFISPYSISTAMAMVYAGANGQTADEIAKVMHFPKDAVATAMNASLLRRHLTKSGKADGSPITTANALWADLTCEPRPTYRSLISEYFSGGFRRVDFFHKPQAARAEINQWVERATKNRIRNLLKPEVITSQIRVVLTNAITFDAEWVFPFKPESTTLKPFLASGTESVKVPTMVREEIDVGYKKLVECELIEIPIKQYDFAVVIALPAAQIPMSEFEADLSKRLPPDLIASLESCHGRLSLPKFSTTFFVKLRSHLETLGMASAFTSGADFSNLSDEQLWLSAVEHKTMFAVDETGARAASATAAMFKSSLSRKVEVDLDRPFLLFLIHKPTRSILFCGRLLDPRVPN